MLPLAADENFNHALVRGLLRRCSTVDVARLQDAGLSGTDDPTVLAWCAREDRVLMTHDVSTMTRHAYDRVRAGQAMPGIFVVGNDTNAAIVIEDLRLLAECSLPGEWEGQILYLPLK